MLYSHQDIEEIFKRFSLNNPSPRGELYYINDFTLLIAVLLSAQATDISVNKATKLLFQKADNAASMNEMPLELIEAHIKSIGLWRTKAKNIKALCKILVETYQGKIPRDRDSLMTLPGVGRKTANVVANIAFHEPHLAVDTHIFRIANRIKLAPYKTPFLVEEHLIKIIPLPYLNHAHLWLILHGRYICKARTPLCSQCLIKDLCKADINPYSQI